MIHKPPPLVRDLLQLVSYYNSAISILVLPNKDETKKEEEVKQVNYHQNSISIKDLPKSD